MNNLFDQHLSKRVAWSLIFSAIFVVVGYYLPKLYLQYFDTTNYIEFIEPVSFDRKVYPPCDTAKALIKARLLVDSETDSRYRLLLIRSQDHNEFEVVSARTTQGFVKKQKDVQTFVADYPLACNLKEGTYFFRGEITYKVRGVEKNYSFESQLFTINKEAMLLNPASEVASPSGIFQ